MPTTDRTDPQPVGDDTPFEELYRQLEEVTAALEQGDLPLDRSLDLYERGMELARACRALLDDAEQRVERLRAADEAGFEQ